MPGDLCSFAASNKVGHIFWNNEFGVNESKRDLLSSAMLEKENINTSIFDDQVIFESGAILLYLAKKYNKFLNEKDYWEIIQWVFFQMAYVGPMLGQHHQFHHYNPGKSKFGEERYFKISERIYKELDERLSKSKYLSGNNYTIADIGTFPWIARHEWHDIGLKNYKNLTRWYEEISKRDGVKKGFAFMDENEVPPKPY